MTEGKYPQWKRNLYFMVKNNTIDWNTQKNDFLIFGYSRMQKMAYG